MTAEDGERGGSSDVRWKTVPQMNGRQWTDQYVERPEMLMRQNVVAGWLVLHNINQSINQSIKNLKHAICRYRVLFV